MNGSFCSLLSKSVFINLFEWTFLLNGFKLVHSDIICYFYFYKLNVIEIIMIEKEYDYIFNVLLVGNSVVGKSSLILRYVDQIWNDVFL